MKHIDDFLNSITMYRVALYGLLALAFLAIAFSFAGLVPHGGISLLLSLAVLAAAGIGADRLLAALWRAPYNAESGYITVLILFLVLAPVTDVRSALLSAAAAAIAMASKYVLAIGRRHVFNPAAVSLVVMGLLGYGVGLWWVATPSLFLPVAAVSFLVARKVRRLHLAGVFLSAALAVLSLQASGPLLPFWKSVLLSWPLLFFAGIMLTEPATTPPTRRLRIVYGALVGILFAVPFHAGPLYNTPELALVLGNVFAYAVSSKQKIRLRLKGRKQLSKNVYDFSFVPDRKPAFRPGQYMEWTVPPAGADGRGNRRYFTISSSPGEETVRLGVRIDMAQGSSFKRKLMALEEGNAIIASQAAGEFVLPEDPSEKLFFIAGGIGITPFRSMLRHLADRGEKRDIVLVHACATPGDFAYREDLEALKDAAGASILYLPTEAGEEWRGRKGYVTEALIREEAPDFAVRRFYLSGPAGMVRAYKKLLRGMGIRRIETDYFPGF